MVDSLNRIEWSATNPPKLRPQDINQIIDYLEYLTDLLGAIPEGGSDGQVLTKTSGTDFATAWETPAAGGGSVYINATDYGDLSTDTGDAAANVATLNAAIAAANAVSGTVQVPGQYIPINANVAFPSHVGLVGAGKEVTQFAATHSSARLTFTEASASIIADFVFNGNDIATAGIIVTTGVNQLYMANVGVHHVDGRGASFHDVQNSTVIGLSTNYCQYGHAVDDGCGNVVFLGSQSGSNEIAQLWLGNTGLVDGGYDTPTQIVFDTPMFEFFGEATVDSIAAIICETADHLLIRNGRVIGPVDGHAINMEGGSLLIDGGLIWGDEEVIALSGSSSIVMMTQAQFFTSSLTGTGVVATGSSTGIVNAGLITWQNITTKFTGDIALEHVKFVPSHNFKPYNDGQYMERYGLIGDSGFRFFRNYYGDVGWGDGSATSPDVVMKRHGADLLGLEPGDSLQIHTGYLQQREIADPSAPESNACRLYVRDNGSGKTQVVARFASGAVQVIATEP